MDMPRKLRRILIGGGVVLVLILLVSIIVPLVVKHQAIAWVATHTHRTLTVESLRLNPLTLGVTLRGVSLSEPDDAATAFVAFERLKTGLSLRSVWDRALILRKIELAGPRVRLVRTGENSYNFADLQQLGQSSEAAPPPPAEEKEPLHFSLNNITVTDGRIDFIDRALAPEKQHVISELEIGIPFIGNIPYLTDLYVTPNLSAKVNDAPFAFEGKLKPFKDGAETIVDLTLDAFDLAYYTPYLPATLPVKIQGGILDSRMTATYRVSRDQKPEVELAGQFHLARFEADDPAGGDLLRVKDLAIEMLPSRPLANDLAFKSIDIDGVEVAVHRNRQGEWNFSRPPTPNTPVAAPEETATPTTEAPASAPLHLRIAALRLGGSSVRFHDEQPQGGFQSQLHQIGIEVKNLDTAVAAPAEVSIQATSARNETLAVAGQLGFQPLGVALSVKVGQVPLAVYYPYLQEQLSAPISGLLTVQGMVRFDRTAGVRLEEGELTLDKLQVPFGRKDSLRLPRLAAMGIRADVAQKAYHLEELSLVQGRVDLTRFRDGHWSPQDLLRQAAKVEAPAAETRTGDANSPPHFTLGQLQLQDWRVTFQDETVDNALAIQGLNLAVNRFAYPEQTVERLTLGARLDGGQLQFETGGTLAPPALEGRLRLKALPLPRFWAYAPDRIRILPVSGALSSDLRFRYAQEKNDMRGYCRGSLGLGNLYLVNADDASDLLRWENLSLDRINADLTARKLSIAQIALSGLVTQLAIAPDGSVNFGKLVAEETATPSASAEPAADQSEVVAPKPGPPPDWTVAIDVVTLQNGQLDFVDRHMSPVFQARMASLGGRISGLSSAPDMQAAVDLRGSLDNRSPLLISGTMNPLSKTPQADIRIAFSDIELSPASPYAGRYLGYSIDKGKLFLDLNYRVADKQLAATNKVFIDQFTFGPEVESADAVKLPVKLAVALLKDQKGEIHLDVPVSGRTDDPEFSVLRIVWQVLRNLLVKAATSPLALLSSLTGGEEFTAIHFEPGSARLTAADREVLGKVATALLERPVLKLQLTGHAEMEVDQEAYRRQLLDSQIRRAKLLDLVRHKEIPPGQNADNIEVTAEERSRYLREVYRKASFPKPRNAIGMLKELPDAEMEKLIYSHTVVGPEQLTELAWARSTAVLNELIGRGLPTARIFQNNVVTMRPKGKPDNWRGNLVEFGVATD